MDFKNTKVKAVLLSFLTYIGITMVLGTVLSIFTSFPLMKNYDMTDPEQQKLFQAAVMEDNMYLIGSVIITLIGGFVGGIVAAKVAKIAEVSNAMVTGVLSLIVGLLFKALSPTEIPWMLMVVSTVVMFGGLYAGAVLVTPDAPESQS